ncbi:SGNH/GDSL hydrolase family protein [Albibacterium indicum]|uniref:SGNH/GDSL hydrolase family protein n=1 Tax=Albibacterium indicum TaxID=2292082 RepID=UPI000E4910F4|nr:SGNH/GDSL hydrolase family protein [Pedobacter indicus]
MRIKFYVPFILCLSLLVFSSMALKTKRIVFFGDSITQAGVKPEGYITILSDKLKAPDYELIGAGIGGNKVYDLYLRIENDVLAKKPDIVVVYVGINDVWHKKTSHTGTDYNKYIMFYQAIIDRIKENGSDVVLCTPSVIGEKVNGQNELDEDLDKYAGAIRELAEKNNAPLCDLRSIFSDYEKTNNKNNQEKDVLTTDGVHLNKKGNQLVADSLLPFLQ